VLNLAGSEFLRFDFIPAARHAHCVMVDTTHCQNRAQTGSSAGVTHPLTIAGGNDSLASIEERLLMGV
jgi:hypothetical protein